MNKAKGRVVRDWYALRRAQEGKLILGPYVPRSQQALLTIVVGLLLLATTVSPVAAQSATSGSSFSVQVRVASGKPAVGVEVELLAGDPDGNSGLLVPRTSEMALTDPQGVAHFTNLPGSAVYLYLHPGTSGLSLVNAAAQDIQPIPLRFPMQVGGARLVVQPAGWIVPDAAANNLTPPATPRTLPDSLAAQRPQPMTWDEVLVAEGLPTQNAAEVQASATAWQQVTAGRRAMLTAEASPPPPPLPADPKYTPLPTDSALVAGNGAQVTPTAAATQAATASQRVDNWATYLLGLALLLTALLVVGLRWVAARRSQLAMLADAEAE